MRLPLVLLAVWLGAMALRSRAETAAATPVKIGAYYFDGWSGKTHHITDRLKTEFANREPVWGWKDDTVEILEQQIDYAANAGLGFWSFCWYWPENGNGDIADPHNSALDLYLKAKNRSRLGFCLLVANHRGFRIGPKDWPAVTARWMALLKEPGYLTVGGKPLLIIFSPEELLLAFGGADKARAALDQLRSDAQAAGLPGVTIAACATPGPGNGWSDLSKYRSSGFDVFTGYCYTGAGPQIPGTKEQPFANMIPGHEYVWDRFAERGERPYIPLVTTGWDKRPWETDETPPEKRSRYYADRSPAMVQEMTGKAISWVLSHPANATAEKLILLYAWNENGEGGYLTPTKAEGGVYLDAVTKALRAPVETKS